MRIKIMIFFSIVVFSVLNYGIYQKEYIKDHGQTLLLELVPVDPRSLMQGDYMRLSYAIEGKVPKLPPHKNRGEIVIREDEKNVGQFVRLYAGEILAQGEKLLHFQEKDDKADTVSILPNTFFFQERHAKYYQNAKYGVFKFDNRGNYILVGLADKDMQEIVLKE